MALIKFHGIDTPEDAENLRGISLEVALDEVPSLSADSYYHFQILDMEIWTQDGELLGVVEDIISTGSNDVYVVRQGKLETLVPALDDVIVDVDVEKGRITVNLPDGLR
jgi:16S rRNA processing protein RimM